jgi:hypothetical protein
VSDRVALRLALGHGDGNDERDRSHGAERDGDDERDHLRALGVVCAHGRGCATRQPQTRSERDRGREEDAQGEHRRTRGRVGQERRARDHEQCHTER